VLLHARGLFVDDVVSLFPLEDGVEGGDDDVPYGFERVSDV
jgi:hypothetical protein